MKFVHARPLALTAAVLSLGLLTGCGGGETTQSATPAPTSAPEAATCQELFGEAAVSELGAALKNAPLKEVKAQAIDLNTFTPTDSTENAFPVTQIKECVVGTGAEKLTATWVAFDASTKSDLSGPLLADKRFEGRPVPVPNYGFEGPLDPKDKTTLERIAVGPTTAVFVSGGGASNLQVDKLLAFKEQPVT